MDTFTKLTLVTALSVLGVAVHANDPAVITERARLENAITELNHLQNFMNETEQGAKHNASERFNYDAFEADLNLLKNGIERYLNYHTTRPGKPKNQIESVSGEYRT